MNEADSLGGLGLILGAMGLAALLERVAPLFGRSVEREGRAPANLGLTTSTLLLNAWLTTVAGAMAVAGSRHSPMLLSRLGLPDVLEGMIGIAVLDFFFGYLAHWAMHKSPLLWRVHRVHHSDPFVDVSTTYRTHPAEVLWRFLCLSFPIWLLGVSATAVATYRILSAINALLEHADLRLWRPLESLAVVWVTPNMHKVHHSRLPLETDSNYGNILSLFDRLFRTFTPTERAFSVTYGLDDVEALRARSLSALLRMPFQDWPSKSYPTMTPTPVRVTHS